MSDIRFNRWLHQSGTGGVSQDSSGNIGIGTTVPTMALDIRGDVNIGDTININNASGIISATTLTATTLTATTGTFSGDISVTGNASIAGTLTYEDVSNIDAVGIITAQSDIIVGGGLTVTGISTFNNDVKLLDSDKLKFGIGEDLQIYHDPGTGDSFISETGAGNLKLTTSSFRLRNAADTEHIIWANQDAEVRLYHDNSKKFETTSSGAIVTGILTASTFSGNLTGNVTGDLTGNLAGISSIAAISSSISDTATDVFVYDTRKDSDGGAWRKRTQNTSWYNETLGTSTRGTRREFPAVAVIVAEATKVTIYDGDDPDLPMWMEFDAGEQTANGKMLQFWGTATTGVVSSVTMLNGVMVVGTNNGSSSGIYVGITAVNFASDSAYYRRNASNQYIIIGNPISDRNVNQYGGYASTGGLGGGNANDVAMTVLPNAPIDDATGLPIPTIAVATESGVSVVRDDGNVVDITQNSPYKVANNVFFSDYGKLLYDTEDTSVVYEVDIPSSDIGYGVYNSTSNGRVIYPTGTHGGFSSGEIRLLGRNMGDGGKLITKGAFAFDANGASETINGLTLFDREESDPAKNSLVAFVASDYNTGWMHGDCKGAFLSDTSTTNKTNGQTDPDRAVNNTALTVTGTITKSAVATGADLVAYSGFSASNYLQQPYNSDLAPGTGAYSVSCWFKTGTSSGDQYIFDRNGGGSGSRNLLLIMNTGVGGNSANKFQWWHRDGSGNVSDIHVTDKTVTDNNWHQVVALNDGTSYRVYVDGEVSSVTNSVIRNVGNDNSPPMFVGIRHTGGSTFMTGSMALFRYSKSAPSAEQVKKMYEDEKCLFHENAKATLYGSSDAVTALAFDDTTNLLHVGTSAGRSEFQGLCRINNTTDAVTTAISASNGLVAEQ